jgi:hypothetical protein
MPEFNVRSDSVNVEQIMEQIRARIREKRGVDYTEQQIRELAQVKLEKFLDPRGVRSDLLDQFRKAQPAYEPPELPNFAFEDATLFESHRAPIQWIRKLLMPLLKLLFNPNPLIQALHIQSRLNTMNAEREARQEAARRQMDQLYYELVHNLVVETTRTGIEVKNLKMRVESISSRLEFNERRARALEGAVVYKTAEAEEAPPPRPAPQFQQQPRQQPPPRQQPHQQRHTPPQPAYIPPPAPIAAPPQAAAGPAAVAEQPSQVPAQGQAPGQGVPGEGPGQRSRRRRRRRGRRGGGAAAGVMATPGSAAPGASADAPESGDALDQLDAMDRMDDDGSPESEEAHASAVEQVEQAVVAETQQAETPLPGIAEPPRVEEAHREQPQVEEPPQVEPSRVDEARPVEPSADHAEPPRDAEPAAPADSAPIAPPAPDRADHDPQ